MKIEKATQKDLSEILKAQYDAFLIEGINSNDFNIQPLKQSIQEITDEFNNGIILKAVLDNKIIGSVRAKQINNIVYIGKLFILEEYQGRGYAKELMHAIENKFDNCEFQLFTNFFNNKNVTLYKKLGYIEFKKEKASPKITFIYFKKYKNIKQD